MRKKAYITKFIAPYRVENGKYRTNLPLDYKAKSSGVYFIKSNRTGKVIYIGFSNSNLYFTIYRHFADNWNEPKNTDRKTRYLYDRMKYTVRVILTTAARAELLEKFLIMKFQPRDNAIKYKQYLTPKEIETSKEILNDTDNVKINSEGNAEDPF